MAWASLDGFSVGDVPEVARESDADATARSVQVFKGKHAHTKYRVLSEEALDAVLDWHFEQGQSYHVISAGDVDALTYMRHVLKQQRIHYAMVASWCLAKRDAEEMDGWVARGMVGRIDAYVGELFKGGYRGCGKVLEGACRRGGGRMAILKTHSKLMLLYGERFDCCIESSANIDTNSRIEQTCLTVDTGLCDFYKSFYDELPLSGYEGWRPWTRTS